LACWPWKCCNCPYTTTLHVRQEHSLPWLPVPQLEVQVYHDARMAEVVSAEHARRFRSIYPYPNAAMHQPDEKPSSTCSSVNG
jgi:uncharacterized protein YqiB (DUF1249 family)